MPIATHWLKGHDLPYRWMHGDWHGLAKMAAGRHPLSLVDNVKIYFDDNTRYFNPCFYYVIEIYWVRLACLFECPHCCIGVMALSIKRQQCAIVNDVPSSHLPLSLADTVQASCMSCSCSLAFVPLPHPWLLRARPFLVGCCIFTFHRQPFKSIM